MNILTYGEIMDGGASVFHCVARDDAGSLLVTFSGVVRVDNPARHLAELLADLRQLLPGRAIERTVIDFTELFDEALKNVGYNTVVQESVNGVVPTGPASALRWRWRCSRAAKWGLAF